MAWLDVEPIRTAIEESGVDHNTIARRLGCTVSNSYNSADTARVRRRLGILNTQNGREKRVGVVPRPQRFIRDATAIQLLDAAGLDPVDVGI